MHQQGSSALKCSPAPGLLRFSLQFFKRILNCNPPKHPTLVFPERSVVGAVWRRTGNNVGCSGFLRKCTVSFLAGKHFLKC